MSQEQYVKGEFYDFVEIVTLDEAIDDYLYNGEIRDDVERETKWKNDERVEEGKPLLSDEEEKEIWDETEQWYRDNIEEVDGFFLRSDGKVEIDRSDEVDDSTSSSDWKKSKIELLKLEDAIDEYFFNDILARFNKIAKGLNELRDIEVKPHLSPYEEGKILHKIQKWYERNIATFDGFQIRDDGMVMFNSYEYYKALERAEQRAKQLYGYKMTCHTCGEITTGESISSRIPKRTIDKECSKCTTIQKHEVYDVKELNGRREELKRAVLEKQDEYDCEKEVAN